jgi:hypothetical protein
VTAFVALAASTTEALGVGVPSPSPLRLAAAPVPVYLVNFSAIGLPGGTSWTVDLAGTSQSSFSSTIDFAEPNGTYLYTAHATVGTDSQRQNGSVTVHGAPVEQSVAFPFSSTGGGANPPAGAPGGPASVSSSSSVGAWVTGAAVAAGVVGLAALLGARRRTARTATASSASQSAPTATETASPGGSSAEDPLGHML